MEILSNLPLHQSQGNALSQTVSITFDEAIDIESVVATGNFIVTSIASKVINVGPGLEDIAPTTDREPLLSSKTYTGQVVGSISTDDGLTFTFTPDSPFEALKDYTVLVGEGVVTRTISSLTKSIALSGTGVLLAKGPYQGGGVDSFVVNIKTSGPLRSSTFTYTRTSDGMESEAIVTNKRVLLEDGVYLEFGVGTYAAGERWTFTVTPGESLSAIFKFTFSTGPDSHIEPYLEIPSFEIQQREVQGIRRIDTVSSVNSAALSVVEILPTDGDYNISAGLRQITIIFNKELDPACLPDLNIEVLSESLPMDETSSDSVFMEVIPSISGNALTLTFAG